MATALKIAQLSDKEYESLSKRAKKEPQFASHLAKYERHVTRIRTLQRVLDPKDRDAGSSASKESLETELSRRAGELAELVVLIKQSLA